MPARSSPEKEEEGHEVEVDAYSIYGAHGTLAAVSDQAHYDARRRRRSDDAEAENDGRIDFPRRLYGRDEEMKRLASVWEGCRDGAERRGRCCVRAVFVSGYSGVGKSALVHHFVGRMNERGGGRRRRRRRGQRRCDDDDGSGILYVRGKFNENSKCLVFSAFAELLEHLVDEMMNNKEREEWRQAFRRALNESTEIGPGTEGEQVLRETWPALWPLLDGKSKNDNDNAAAARRDRSQFLVNSTVTMNAIKEYTLALLSLLCNNTNDDDDTTDDDTTDDGTTDYDSCNSQLDSSYSNDNKDNPQFILFLDDLQWADPPSLDMLSHLIEETKNWHNLLFLCAYRSNEVHDHHPLRRVIQKVMDESNADRNHGNDCIHHLELYPLSPSDIQQFIADTLLREQDDDHEDVRELTHVVYQKTMGNIFFVMQAMEELVRKNALYYDVMCFSWTFADSASRAGQRKELLANYISEDVVQSVKGKILGCLSPELRRVLIVMAYIPHNALEISVLRHLLRETGTEVTEEALMQLLNEGVREGMLLRSYEHMTPIFAHDRIRQASKECIEGDDRDALILRLAHVLLHLHRTSKAEEKDKGSSRDIEWCLYVAVDYLNAFAPSSPAEALEWAKLNCVVAKKAREKGAMEKEYELLENGMRFLVFAQKVWVEYELTLEMYNGLIESECFLGLYDKAKLTVNQVLEHARTMDDKLVAYRHQILCISVETRDYAKSLEEGIKVLNIYGFDFPSSPTVKDIVKEEMRVKIALHHRPYSCLLERPIAENPIMELFKNLTRFALLSGNDRLLRILCWKAIRVALTKGIDHHFHTILVTLGNSMAKEKSDIKTAFEIATVAVHLSEKHRDDRGNYAYTQLVAYQGVLFQLQSFRSGMDVMLQCYKDLKLAGELDPALGSAMIHFLTIFAAGIPIGPLVESKLLLVEEFAKKTENISFATIFQMQRQFVLNLWKTSDYPTELKGIAFDEEERLAALTPTSKVYSMTLRDTSTYRLQLAFLFNDQNTMRKMLDILRDYPMSDISVPRLHLRLTFMGLSAFALLQTSKNKTIEGIAKSCLAHFSSLSKLGSVNATPVYHFLLALKQPGIKSFELAIDSCSEASLPHLEAMAKERYGLHLCHEGNSLSIGQDYLVSAYWLYYNWGAHAKASAMWEEHACIRTASKDQANSRIEKTSSIASGKSQKEKGQILIETRRKKSSNRKQFRFGMRSFRFKGKATAANVTS